MEPLDKDPVPIGRLTIVLDVDPDEVPAILLGVENVVGPSYAAEFDGRTVTLDGDFTVTGLAGRRTLG
jgi:hypothetical protein